MMLTFLRQQRISTVFLLLSLFLGACGGSQRIPPATGAGAELNWCLQLAAKKKYDQTINCLEAFKSRHPSSDEAAEADLMIGDSYFRQKEYLLAAETYKEFLKEYPYHPKADYAYYKSGLSYLNETPKSVGRDQQYLDLAVKSFELLVNYFPNSPYYRIGSEYYTQARTKQAKKNYRIGRFYYKYKEYRASLPRFEEIVRKYPGLGFDEKSFYYMTLACIKLNKLDEARQVAAVFEQRFPESSLLKRVKEKLS